MTKPTGKGRGGQRKGAGRPPNPQATKQPFPVKLPPEVIEWLRTRKKANPGFSMGGWIGATLRDAIHDRRSLFVAVCTLAPEDPDRLVLYGFEADGLTAARKEAERIATATGHKLVFAARWRHWPGAMGMGQIEINWAKVNQARPPSAGGGEEPRRRRQDERTKN